MSLRNTIPSIILTLACIVSPLLSAADGPAMAEIKQDGKLRLGMYLGFEGLSFKQRGRTMGLEVETIWYMIDNLQILANYSYLDAQVRKGRAIDPADLCAQAPGARRTQVTTVNDAFCGLQYLQDISGNSMPSFWASSMTTSICSDFNCGVISAMALRN